MPIGQKVYIIDHEIMSPIAVGKEEIIPSIKSYFTADRILKNAAVEGIPFKKGAEITQALNSYYANEPDQVKEVCSIDRKFELLAAAYGKASERFERLTTLVQPKRTGVILGVGADAAPYKHFENEIIEYLNNKLNPVYELMVQNNKSRGHLNKMNNPYDIYSIYLAQKFKAEAFQRSILTACVSSTQAIAFGYDAIKRGEVDVVITGGTDSIINLLAIISFGKLGVIAETEEPISCKPFDMNRFGTLAGECAGIAILASEEFITSNQIEPIVEVMGYGNTLDAYKITAPDPSGESMARAIENAVTRSNISFSDIDYINAHGTGTKQNDGTELKAIKQAFGENANRVAVSTTKDRHGHAIAAAGIQEVSILMELMQNDIIPGNLHMSSPIDVEMNLVKENKSQKINYALTNNFAFGGINTVLAFKNMK